MVKLLILIVVVFVLFAIENGQVRRGKESTGYTRGITVAHIVCGALITVFAMVHGVGHVAGAGAASLATGVAVLVLLYAEIATGACLKSKRGGAAPSVRTAHKFVSVAVICLLVVHVLVR